MKEWIVKDTLNNKYVQELIRCKDCKHGYEVNGGMMIMCTHGVRLDAHERDWFCADGVKKDE